MRPEMLLKILLIAADAKTDEEKARVAWRFSDAMWRTFGDVPISFSRSFNNLLQDQDWPWVENLWSERELQAFHQEFFPAE